MLGSGDSLGAAAVKLDRNAILHEKTDEKVPEQNGKKPTPEVTGECVADSTKSPGNPVSSGGSGDVSTSAGNLDSSANQDKEPCQETDGIVELPDSLPSKLMQAIDGIKLVKNLSSLILWYTKSFFFCVTAWNVESPLVMYQFDGSFS